MVYTWFNTGTQQASYIYYENQWTETDIVELLCSTTYHEPSGWPVCTQGSHTLAQVLTSKEKKKKTEESGPPVRQKRRWRYSASAVLSCDVTVCVSSSSGLAQVLRRTAERWQEIPVSLESSRPHRCGVYAFDTSEMI